MVLVAKLEEDEEEGREAMEAIEDVELEREWKVAQVLLSGELGHEL